LRFRRYLLAFTLALSLPASLSAGSKEKETPGKQVDSGSFVVFMAGRRVGTETFSIAQNANGSVIQSEFKTEGSANAAVQSSEMQLTGTGEIRRYDWKEVSPGKGQSGILPNDQFLTQKWSTNPDEKPMEQPYLLPPTTSILDDYFFIHREVLVRDGAGFTSHRAAGEEQSEFLASTDNWFRPVTTRTGPDGALYISDGAEGI